MKVCSVCNGEEWINGECSHCDGTGIEPEESNSLDNKIDSIVEPIVRDAFIGVGDAEESIKKETEQIRNQIMEAVRQNYVLVSFEDINKHGRVRVFK